LTAKRQFVSLAKSSFVDITWSRSCNVLWEERTNFQKYFPSKTYLEA